MNTKKMSDNDLKGYLQQRALEEKLDLTDRKNRFTVWSENGNYFSYEGSAADALQKEHQVRQCKLKNSSRTMILDSVEDILELSPSDGRVTETRPR